MKIILMKLTDQGMKNIKEAPERIQAGIKGYEAMGGKLRLSTSSWGANTTTWPSAMASTTTAPWRSPWPWVPWGTSGPRAWRLSHPSSSPR